MCHFVLVFLSPFSIAITSLGKERANLSAFRTFVQGLRFVIVALPGLFSYLFSLLAENVHPLLIGDIHVQVHRLL